MLDHPELIVFVALYDVAVLAALGLLFWACVTDVLTMTIPNEVSLGLLGAFVVAFGIALAIDMPAFSNWKAHGTAFGIIFILTFMMFVLRVWGAGDSKLATGVALWIGLKGIVTFVLVMSLAGIVLALASYVLRALPYSYASLGPQSWPARLKAGERNIPYGIAIAVGAIWAFCSLGYLDLATLMQNIR